MTTTNLILALAALAIWHQLNEIRKYVRELWVNHYQLNREVLEDLIPHDAMEPDKERGNTFNYAAAAQQRGKGRL